ncbi:YhcH/YjgK/YiaL family protein [Staphylococcus intermedius]|uniref:Beta-D-galactosidase n=1 Tax=Staphylococcus intermedius NCTC 11048 TaxID=1141106 RepID=A0A380G7G7_STAIN|nr:YhcH/YjgK/YiaL family protein [Staphylococcus intermedius]PCF65146.1 beta-D-galactosidase [Staphylococcus intermedius]PCF80756.1 beta-D-galactosidase [Staphylococcus intermedius]PCF82105.1 beta-D-galactosidase [Staphylococcus intermedius]PCF88441.1 beta-D-galactosidase [Staphylococcus intermedius]PCF89156.1 beta-D-galactosidase [Staphylococcus intermedius]
MIVAEREDLKRYVAVNPHFSKVVDFLEQTDLATLELGKVDIDGDNVFANCMSYVADGVAGQQFENHQKYIDIHLVLENTEKIAVTSPQFAEETASYDETDDFALFKGEQYQLIEMTPSNLLITFEEDLHQPKIGDNDQPVKKLVFKVLNA